MRVLSSREQSTARDKRWRQTGGNHSKATESFQDRRVAAVVGKRAVCRRVVMQQGGEIKPHIYSSMVLNILV